MKVLIIGGVAGGAAAAARLRRLDEHAEIIVFERTGYISYANCGLPYYIGGVIEKRQSLLLQTPERLGRRFNIDVRVATEVVDVDSEKKQVQVRNLSDGSEYSESYDKLIIATGAIPRKPNMPGIESPQIFTVRTVEDADAVYAFMQQNSPKSAVIAGGGLIGLEMAENLTERGLDVAVVQRGDQVMLPLDYDMAMILHAHLRQKGVTLALDSSISGFEVKEGKIHTLLEEKPALVSDLVILSIGVAPDTHLAEKAGIKLARGGSIVVNEKMQTTNADIYAVGDAVIFPHFITGKPWSAALAGPANKQGRVAADQICGIKESKFAGAQGTTIFKLFDLQGGLTGLNEKSAIEEGLDYDKVVLIPTSHAKYYPGAASMVIKAIFEKVSGRLLGAEIIGFDGVDKRVDVLATALRLGLNIDQLKDLDLAYAPPFSAPKDPVNMVGVVGENALRGLLQQFHWDEVDAVVSENRGILLDVRTAREREAAAEIAGSVHIPLEELRQRLPELDKNRTIYVFCQSGQRSYTACRALNQLGYECRSLAGGIQFYQTVSCGCCFENNRDYCGNGQLPFATK